MKNNHIIRLINKLVLSGVKSFVLCPGSRDAPLIECIHNLKIKDPDVKTYNHFEEREAAFFALGQIKLHNQPVAVVTTSGTAASELLPATIEAYYSQLPLILITADRPVRFRGTGAPQSIEQKDLFGIYVRRSIEVIDDFSFDVVAEDLSLSAPTHFNVSIEEYAAEDQQSSLHSVYIEGNTYSVENLNSALTSAKRPCAIIGGLSETQRESVGAFLSRIKIPYFSEALSGITSTDSCFTYSLKSSDKILSTLNPDFVLRIGDVPTGGFWRDLERTFHTNVWAVSDKPFSGSPGGRLIRGDIKKLLGSVCEIELSGDFIDSLFSRDLNLVEKLEKLLKDLPYSEPSLIRKIAELTPKDTKVYLGNSLPIRQWDLVTRMKPIHKKIFANRGANGIDGQVSTLFGLASDGAPTLGVLGDLTTLYGLSAPWILSSLSKLNVCLVVINNYGGKIFERVSNLRKILKQPEARKTISSYHALNFRSWAETWGIRYRKLKTVDALDFGGGGALIEVVPDMNETQEFWKQWESIEG